MRTQMRLEELEAEIWHLRERHEELEKVVRGIRASRVFEAGQQDDRHPWVGPELDRADRRGARQGRLRD